MAATLKDMWLLSTDTTFEQRVGASMAKAAVAISTEAWSVPFHRERQERVTQILNNPAQSRLVMKLSIATDSAVINAATSGGTVPLTDVNLATQAALVTDAQIDNAVSGQFNSFFRTPSK